MSLSLGGVAFGLRPQSTPPRDRPRSVNQTQTKSKPPTVNILKRVNHFQEQTKPLFQRNILVLVLSMSQIFCSFVFRKQPQNLLIMPVKVYVIDDPILISFIEDGDLEGFKEYLDSDDTIIFSDPEIFDTEEQALAFCSGIGYGLDERAPVERFPLRSSEEADLPFIEAIENY